LIGQALAKQRREDSAQVDYGWDWHSFTFAVPAGSEIDPEVVEVRRSVDGAVLKPLSEDRRAELRQMAEASTSGPASAGGRHPRVVVHRRAARR
jgi:hypothetical protein